jgi:hypothetical protein
MTLVIWAGPLLSLNAMQGKKHIFSHAVC